MFLHYFTLQQANELLPVVREELAHLQYLNRECEMKHRQRRMLNNVDQIVHGDYQHVFELEAAHDFLHIQICSYVKQLKKQHIYIKDIEKGVVEFPGKLGDEYVLLCWKQGEEFVTHYHRLDETFYHRKRIFRTEE
ncbi:hypothetical protein SAMN05192534_101467 [Alteribacillus persepolensis]|uniref:DUF2203 family protein n=1 Tax=Alteribacillus persepolensis TaxID=568899 RepID=A0A1G7ZA89_9BACI|nr:DUF2203 domain-containing protein [Alteribacillus persepolensis]SDH05604.1 hypothetical protein SAMN05192534_101467 [Alteribacillus persepolensis]